MLKWREGVGQVKGWESQCCGVAHAPGHAQADLGKAMMVIGGPSLAATMPLGFGAMIIVVLVSVLCASR